MMICALVYIPLNIHNSRRLYWRDNQCVGHSCIHGSTAPWTGVECALCAAHDLVYGTGLPAAPSFTDASPAVQARANLYFSANSDHSMHELLCSSRTSWNCPLQQIRSASIASLLRSLSLCRLPESLMRSRLCTSTLGSSGKITASAPGVFSRLSCESYDGNESHAGIQIKGAPP